MLFGIRYSNSFKIENLTTRKNGWNNLVLLRRRQNENGVGRGFLQGFQKRIECRLAEHVDLINDEDLVLTLLRLKPNLLRQGADVVDRVVTRSIEFGDVERSVIIEGYATRTLVARLKIFRPVLAVQDLRQNSRARRFTDATGPTKQKGMGEVIRLQSVLQRLRNVLLTNDLIKFDGAILTCGYYKFGHGLRR